MKGAFPISVILFAFATYLIGQAAIAGLTPQGALFFIAGGALEIIAAVLLSLGFITKFSLVGLVKAPIAVFGLLISIVQLLVQTAVNVTDPLAQGIEYVVAGLLLFIAIYLQTHGYINLHV